MSLLNCKSLKRDCHICDIEIAMTIKRQASNGWIDRSLSFAISTHNDSACVAPLANASHDDSLSLPHRGTTYRDRPLGRHNCVRASLRLTSSATILLLHVIHFITRYCWCLTRKQSVVDRQRRKSEVELIKPLPSPLPSPREFLIVSHLISSDSCFSRSRRIDISYHHGQSKTTMLSMRISLSGATTTNHRTTRRFRNRR